jgi:hypothetical protein
VPPLSAGVVIVYVLFLVPGIVVAFLPSQVALHLVHSPQLPTQLIGAAAAAAAAASASFFCFIAICLFNSSLIQAIIFTFNKI